jgi:hypothetical protein
MGGIAHCLVVFQLQLEIGEDKASETVQTVQTFQTFHTFHTVQSHQFTENLSGLDGSFAFVSQAKALK